MCSPRFAAQLGLAAASLVLIFSLSVLVAGAANDQQPQGQTISLAPEHAALGSMKMIPHSK